MSMSKKDFIALADAFKDALSLTRADGVNVHHRDGVRDAMERVADVCAQSNPRFMRDRWLGYIAGENGSNGRKIKAASCKD